MMTRQSMRTIVVERTTRAVAEKMLRVCTRMSDDNLLKRMMHGQTQNQNECFNSTIWLRCPRSKG